MESGASDSLTGRDDRRGVSPEGVRTYPRRIVAYQHSTWRGQIGMGCTVSARFVARL
jgi:hypothetical protein